MIVCHCHGVSDREIRRAARAGALDVEDVAGCCRAGGSCGGCRPLIREILEHEQGGRVAASAPKRSASEAA